VFALQHPHSGNVVTAGDCAHDGAIARAKGPSAGLNPDGFAVGVIQDDFRVLDLFAAQRPANSEFILTDRGAIDSGMPNLRSLELAIAHCDGFGAINRSHESLPGLIEIDDLTVGIGNGNCVGDGVDDLCDAELTQGVGEVIPTVQSIGQETLPKHARPVNKSTFQAS
jgi:hypothetical protein